MYLDLPLVRRNLRLDIYQTSGNNSPYVNITALRIGWVVIFDSLDGGLGEADL